MAKEDHGCFRMTRDYLVKLRMNRFLYVPQRMIRKVWLRKARDA